MKLASIRGNTCTVHVQLQGVPSLAEMADSGLVRTFSKFVYYPTTSDAYSLGKTTRKARC